MKRVKTFFIGTVAVSTFVSTASAQVIMSDDFNYANLAALQANWGSTAGLSLDSSNGNPSPSAGHDGSATVHQWAGSAISVTPTDANPLVLKADIWYSGLGNQRNTVGLRTGANPLFEIGFYNQGSPAANGLSARILSFAGNNNWTEIASYTALGSEAEWIRVQATFTTLSLNITYDLGADGTVDGTFTSTGATPTGNFTDLRFGGPSGLLSGGGGFAVDNISLAVVPVPEPSTIALGLLGGAGLMASYLRRRSK